MKKIIIKEEEKNEILNHHQNFKKILSEKLLNLSPLLIEQQLTGNALMRKAKSVCPRFIGDNAPLTFYPAESNNYAIQTEVDGEIRVYTSEPFKGGEGYTFYVLGDDYKPIETGKWSCAALNAGVDTNELSVANKEGFYDWNYWKGKNISVETLNNTKFFQTKKIGDTQVWKMTPEYAQTWSLKDPAKNQIIPGEFLKSLSEYNVDQQEWYKYLVTNGLVLQPSEIQLRNNMVEKITIYEPGQNANFPNGLTAFVDKNKRVQLTQALNSLLNSDRQGRKKERVDERKEQEACKGWITVYFQGYVNSDENTPQRESRFRGATPEVVKSNVQECAQNYYKNWDKLRNRDEEFLNNVLDLFMRRLPEGKMTYEGNTVYQPKSQGPLADWQLKQVRRR